MQNLQVQSKQEIKAILSNLRTDSVTVSIRSSDDGFIQTVDLYLSKKESMIESELRTMANAGFILSRVGAQKGSKVVVSFEKKLTDQVLTVIEEIQ